MIGAPVGALRLRVWVTDVWDTVTVWATPDTTIATVKAAALSQAMLRRDAATAYEVKYRGALISNEQETLAQLGVRDHAPMIVLPAHRRPVR